MVQKKVLVTGGAGFVGSNLCERLAHDRSLEVYSLDNYFTGKHDNHVENVTYIEGDTADINNLITIVPDVIYHLGEYSRVEQSFDDIEKVWRYNKDGIFAVLEFVRKTGAKLVYAGSSTKFADNGVGRRQSPYAWSKSTNTELVANYNDWFGISYAIVYFYNVYGKREISAGKYATLIALFREKMKKGEPLTIVKPGTQLRNFTHIDDIVDGLLLVGENGQGDDYGIGNPNSYSVMDIAKMFGGDIEFLPERKGNRMSGGTKTDRTKELGWSAKRNIQDYVEQLRENKWQL